MTFLIGYALITLVVFLFAFVLFADPKDPPAKGLTEAGRHALVWPLVLVILGYRYVDARAGSTPARAVRFLGELPPTTGDRS